MFQLGEIMSLVRRETERAIRRFHKPPRVGFISSYDPKEHRAKVTFQPTGAESGWIPMTAMAVGNLFGEHHAPNIGDQVKVEFQEGEHDVGRVTTRLFNKQNPPHQLQPGEYAKIHENGAGHKHFQDGSVKYAGPQYFKVGQQQPGQSGHTQTGQQNGTQQNQQQQQQQQQQAGKQCMTYGADGSCKFEIPSSTAQGQGQPTNPRYDSIVQSDITHTSTQGNRILTANQAITHTAQQGDITHTAQQGNINRSAPLKKITDTAPLGIFHNGPTNISSTLGVTLGVLALGYGTTSDHRLKSDFAELSDVLPRALQLPVWRFKVHPYTEHDGCFIVDWGKPKPTFGAVAQEVLELFPELVSGEEIKGPLHLDESKVAFIALRALQEYVAKTDAHIDALDKRIEELERGRS